MATNEGTKDSRRVSSCDEFMQCRPTLMFHNPAIRWGRRDLTVDHLILANIM